jgi:hypothetical protein
MAAGSASHPAALISESASGQFQPEPLGGANLILLSNGIVIDTDRPEPDLPPSLTIKSYQEGQPGYYVIQFAGPIQEAWKRDLSERGVKFLWYLPNYAFVVRMDPSLENQARLHPAVRWLGLYQPAYKISGQPELKAREGRLTTVILVHYDEDINLVLDGLKAMGVEVLESTVSEFNKMIKTDLPLEALESVAGMRQISWIEPWYPNRLHNALCQWVVQANDSTSRRIWNKGLRGEGQVLSSSDSGIRVTHNMFYDSSVPLTTWGDYPTHRKVVAYKQIGEATFGDEAVNYYHGSHTGGTLCGDDSINGGSSAYDGMAYKARIYFMDGGGSTSGIWGYNDLAYLFGPPHGGVSGYPETRAYIMSNSWGSQQTSGPMPYDAQCMSLDQYTWANKDFLPFFSQGNTDGGNYVGRPAVSKNCISVGASRNGANAATLATFSVYGPTQDGRTKPMVVAPGDGQTANTGLWSVNGSGNTGYIQMMGTSMSCPAAAGATVLVRQYYTEGWYPSGIKTPADAFVPSAALMKATLLAGADKGTPAIPDTRYGWGRVNLDSSLFFDGDARKLAVVDDATGLQTGQYKEYTFTVADSLGQFRAALCWTDYPGQPGAGRQLVNDLDMMLTDPYGTTYKGNVFGSSVSTPNSGNYDSLNVEENFRRLSGAYRPGAWKLKVSAKNTPQGPQPYAVAVTGRLSGQLSWTPAPLVGINSTTVHDAGQVRPNGRLDPSETDTIRIVLVNSGPVDATNVNAKLRTTSGYVTRVDSTADYGNIAAGGGTSAGDAFLVTMSAATPEGTTIPFVLHWVSATGDSSDINFNLVCGIARYAWADHNVGNVTLSVTKWGSIGYLTVNTTGNGMKYPSSSTSWLYHSSFVAGNANNYVVDRFYPSTGQTGSDSGNTDWKCYTRPDSGVTMLGSIISNQDSWAEFNDSSAWFGGSARTQGLQVTQMGYAWIAPYDFVVLRYKLKNGGASALNNMYAGIVADFDMGAAAATNIGEADTLVRKAVYMRQRTTQNPCVGLKLLEGTYRNASLMRNNHVNATYPGYVYSTVNLWNDSTALKFLNGTLKKASAMAATDSADYSLWISAGPFSLSPGDSTMVAFAFVAADTSVEFWSMCDSAQAVYDRTFLTGVAGGPMQPLVPGRALLYQNRPNPFSNATALAYQLPSKQHVRVSVYNVAGQRVRTLMNGVQEAGNHSLAWDGRDDAGKHVSAGVYFCALESESGLLSRKMILVK